MQRVDQIFSIEWGNKGYPSKGHLAERPGKVPLIASGDNRRTFGTHGFYDISARLQHVMSVASTGSAGATYYRGYPCDVSDDALILRPLTPLTERQMVWYQESLRAHRFRWSYGRKVTPDKLAPVLLPDPSAWLDEVSGFDTSGLTKAADESRKELQVKTWRSFRLGSVFEIEKGKRLTQADMSPGTTPFVSATAYANGITAYIATPPMFGAGCISVAYNGSVGEAFYQPDPFFASDDVNVLVTEAPLSPLAALFVCVVIRSIGKSRFCYGRKWSLDKMKETAVRLPSSDGGKTPNFDAMEEFMRSLPFSTMFDEQRASDSISVAA